MQGFCMRDLRLNDRGSTSRDSRISKTKYLEVEIQKVAGKEEFV
jgi:hypothetical protein